MKKILTALLISILCFTLISCGNADKKDTLDLTDMIGRKINVRPGKYERIVAIGAGALRLYSYIGDMDKLVGVEDIENNTLTNRPKMFDQAPRPYFEAYKDLFATLPSCGIGGPNNQAPEMEKILLCEPDLIISEYTDTMVAKAIEEAIGVPVITLSYGSQGVFDSRLKQSLVLLGLVLDKIDRANELVDYINKEERALSKIVKGVDIKTAPNVYIGGLGNWGTTNHLMTSANYAPFNVANIKNVVNLDKNGIFALDLEKFEELAPQIDIMILDAASIKNIKPLLKENPNLFANCKAWQNNEVYLQMAYNVYYTNIEIALANAWYCAAVVYPDLFVGFDITEKLDEITMKFLNHALSSDIYQLKNSFGGYQQIDVTTFFA